MTGRIIIDLFTTLDGVAQAPGGPEEDTTDSFPFGGWQAGVPDEAVGKWVMDGMSTLDALLLGRHTYEVFASYWPHHTTGPEGSIGRLFDRVPKYVASRDAGLDLDWQGSSRVGADLPAEIAQLRSQHEDVHVIGSVDLVQTLLAEQLFDELQLWVYPVVLGQGKKVFPDGAAAANLRLLGAEVGENGAVSLRYAPEPGPVRTGTIGE
ncbi:dihydrofolate reductase family protein [Microbacterium sp. AK031]|uniref:dihydrofolate reductase family protein n=1 Tax=Microbacterium sp. AK031 TaxID=2723076 RepID=UPI002167C049|nr:dihydrofolate reductase family protein [Microbacterium sp. AK031]MCS3843246.1 dihydrofolate reductase [Microbacterium sp. AK031]